MFFLNRFPVCSNLFVLLFLVTPCPVVAVQPCMEWIPMKKKSTVLSQQLNVKIKRPDQLPYINISYIYLDNST